MEGNAVEGLVVCGSGEEVLQALNGIKVHESLYV